MWRAICPQGHLGPLSSDSSCQLDVLWHDSDTLGVDGAQVGVFKQADEVGFTGLLQGTDSRRLETEIGLEVLGNFTNQTLERKLTDEQFSGLLVTTDLTKGHSTWPVTMRFLHSTGRWRTLPRRLSSQLLSRRFTSSGFTGCLLGTSHLNQISVSLFL